MTITCNRTRYISRILDGVHIYPTEDGTQNATHTTAAFHICCIHKIFGIVTVLSIAVKAANDATCIV